MGMIMMMMVMMMVWCGIHGASAATYNVGDTSGWEIGTDYSSWVSGKTFHVGDTLVFNYAGGHTVAEVNAMDYKACSAANSLTSDSSGATTITLRTAGTHFFICGVPSHCSGGMKLSVTAVQSSSDGTATTTSPSSGTPTINTTSPAARIPAVGSTTSIPSSTAAMSPSAAVTSAALLVWLKRFVW